MVIIVKNERETRNARVLRDYENGLIYKMIAEKYNVSMSMENSALWGNQKRHDRGVQRE